MKPTVFFLSIFLFSISIQSFSSASAAKVPHSVLDVAKNRLRTNLYYYTFPADTSSPNRGGGLALGSTTGTNLCPLTVIQRKIELEDGLPLTFSPFNRKRGVVRLSTDLNIQFAFPDSCNQTMVWRLEDIDQTTGRYYVGINGTAGNPGTRTVRNWFKIEPYGHDYRLRYCPSVCKFCKVICKDVGLFIVNGIRRLALSDVPYKIVFRQA